jgi:polysaccharide pyruvyl transferase WcaK-like protein
MYRSFRDEFSRQLIKGIGVGDPNYLFPDQAFGINAEQFSVPKKESGKPVVGVAPIAFFDPRHWNETDPLVYASYVQKMGRIVAWLVKNDHDVAFFHTQVHGDDVVIPDILAWMRAHDFAREAECCREFPVANFKQALAAISQTDMVIASRFHAVLFSYLLKKPVVGISYHQKINDMMKTFGQGDFVLPIESFEVEAAINAFQQLAASTERNAGRIESTMREYRQLLDKHYETVFSMIEN